MQGQVLLGLLPGTPRTRLSWGLCPHGPSVLVQALQEVGTGEQGLWSMGRVVLGANRARFQKTRWLGSSRVSTSRYSPRPLGQLLHLQNVGRFLSEAFLDTP